jgi:hypothetical protein
MNIVMKRYLFIFNYALTLYYGVPTGIIGNYVEGSGRGLFRGIMPA